MPTSAHMPASPPELIERFGIILEHFPDLEQRKMFGYPAAFVATGHMVTGLHGSNWTVRLSEDDGDALRKVGGSDFEPMPGRPMKGFFSLPKDIMDSDEALGEWVGRSQAHALALPPKKPKKPRG
jgi:hypothetical protein